MSLSRRAKNDPYCVYLRPGDGTRQCWHPGYQHGIYVTKNSLRGFDSPAGRAGEDWNKFLNGGPMSMQMRDRWSPNFGTYFNVNRRVVGDVPGWEKWLG